MYRGIVLNTHEQQNGCALLREKRVALLCLLGFPTFIVLIHNGCACGFKAKIKITESNDNPNRLLFKCPKGSYHFFEWWKLKDDDKQLTGNEWDIPYANDQRSDNDSRPYAND